MRPEDIIYILKKENDLGKVVTYGELIKIMTEVLDERRSAAKCKRKDCKQCYGGDELPSMPV